VDQPERRSLLGCGLHVAQRVLGGRPARADYPRDVPKPVTKYPLRDFELIRIFMTTNA
jgi:hypothetical protein